VDVILLLSGRGHVWATHMVMFSLMKTRIHMQLKCV